LIVKSPPGVFARIGFVADLVRVASVAVGLIAAESGHLDFRPAAGDQGHAEVRAHQFRARE
jgi:hypothetical protein